MTLSFFEDVDFDDGAPTEVHPPGRGRRGGGGDGPGGGPRPGMPSGRRRLVVAVVALLVVVIVGWYWVRACQADAQRRAYENYVTDVNSIVKQSDAIGAKLDNALLDPTATKAKLVGEVQSYAASQSAITASAAKLHDTGRLKGLQSWLETTMRYRTQGLQGMAAALQTTLSTKLVPLNDVTNVSSAYGRLYASDILYSDSFQRPATAALTKANVSGVSLSTSTFALSPRDVYPQYLRTLLLRIVDNGSSSPSDNSGGAVGTELVRVIVEPSGHRLTPGSGTVNSVPSSTNLTFKVYVKNSGDIIITKLKVRFAEAGFNAQVHTISSIDPSQTASVSFAPRSPTLGIPTTIKVTSVPQAHEKDATNNTATYTVEYAG
jgi:CARDB